jgi:AraC-like DNA-binding protein
MTDPIPALPAPWREVLDFQRGHLGAAWPAQPPKSELVRLYHHQHPELELNLVQYGTGRYLVGQRQYRMSPGTLLWLFPGQIHCLYQRSPDLRMHKAVWSPALIDRAAVDPVLSMVDPTGVFATPLPAVSSRQLGQLIQEVARADTVTGINNGLAFLLARAWSYFKTGSPLANAADLHPAVAKAASLVLEDPSVSTEDIAQRIGIQVNLLRRIFFREMGISIVTYRQRHCLERIVRDWRPQFNLTHLALASGFGSYTQFHRVFSRHYGFSPREWIARQ